VTEEVFVEEALEALATDAPRYARVVARRRLGFEPPPLPRSGKP